MAKKGQSLSTKMEINGPSLNPESKDNSQFYLDFKHVFLQVDSTYLP